MNNYTNINKFNHMKQLIDNYLYFQNINLINQTIEDLKITRSDKSILIDYFSNNNLLISLNINKHYNKDNPSNFILSYLDDKGKFIKNQCLCFNSNKKNNGVKEINEEQQNKLDILYNIIKLKIEPLNNAAWFKYQKKQKLVETCRKSVESKIISFDSVINPIIKYINYKNNGIVPPDINNLHITDNQNGVFIEILENNIVKGTLTFSKNYPNFDTRVFMVQYIDNNQLTKSEPIGYASNVYAKNILRYPNEKELYVLNNIKQIVDEYVIPLVDSIEKLYKDKNFQYHMD